MKKVILLTVALMICSPANAQFVTGNDIVQSCEDATTACTVLMLSISDLNEFIEVNPEIGVLSPAFRSCRPDSDGVTGGQLSKILSKYLRENPEVLNLPAILLAMTALKEAFPCEE
jgi:hypothetical protein